MEVKRWRVFLDTSALIAGVISLTGAARELLWLGEAGLIRLVVSRQVLTEADRTLSAKLPLLLDGFHSLLRQVTPIITEDPSVDSVRDAGRVIHQGDAPILAAARHAEVDYLVTWNTRHFQTKKVRNWVAFPVVTPGELLKAFREALEREL